MKIVTKSNFLADPEYSRKLANSGDFENCIDKLKYQWNDLKVKETRDTSAQQKMFSELLGEEVILVDNTYRKYNISLKRPDNKVHVHHDDVDYIALVYLNKPECAEDGTAILSHKETGIYYMNEEKFGSELTQEADIKSDSFDISKWNTELFIPMEYNKLLIFEPRYYHAETRTFGDKIEDGRCVEIWHMIKKSKLEYWKEYWKEDIETGQYDVPKELLDDHTD